MEVTEINIKLNNKGRVKAFVTVTFDNSFAVRNIRIVEGKDSLILSMPSRKKPDGKFQDLAHPINTEFRKYLEEKIFKAYEEEVKKMIPTKKQEE